MSTSGSEIAAGERFAFGANWERFLQTVDEKRIIAAESSLRHMLGVDHLAGKSFLDVGSGSGLSSLAARRLGATVLSFDFDADSVACTRELRTRYYPNDPGWKVEQGSVLDEAYLSSLGQFDVVCSWGVLHHTGDMWKALENVVPLVAADGLLFIAIYNDQGGASIRWRKIKQLYNRSPPWGRVLTVGAVAVWFESEAALARLARGSNPLSFATRRRRDRGMSARHDLVDWVGGYPFEVATPEDIFDLYTRHGFLLCRLTTCRGGLGCNQFVFRKATAQDVPAGRRDP